MIGHQQRKFTLELSQVINSTSKTEFLLLRNPASSGKVLRIHSIMMSSDDSTPALHVHRDPTVTGSGTALTINEMRTSGPSPVATGHKNWTQSAEGALLHATFFGNQPYHEPWEEGMYVEEGEDLAIYVRPQTTGKRHRVTIHFVEEEV